MTNEEIVKIREVIREEILGKGVSAEFSELVAIEGGDSYLPREDWTPDDLYTASEELEKLTRGEPLSLTKHVGTADVGWDEEVSTPLVKRAKTPEDGTVIEKCGKQTWTYFYRSGQLDRMSLEDPDIADGSMSFDSEGNELAA